MPGTRSEELLAEIHRIDHELLALNAGDSWRQVEQAGEQAQAVEDYLGGVIDDITGTREGIEEHLGDFAAAGQRMEELLEVPEVKEFFDGIQGGLECSTNVLEEVKGGVAKFKEFVGALQLGEGLTSEDAREQLEAAAEAYELIVGKLEPFISRIPVLGVFIQLWGLSTKRAAEVAGVLVDTVDERNALYAIFYPGGHMYPTGETLKADKIRKLEFRRAQLWNEMIEAAGDERDAANDVGGAVGLTDRDVAVETAIRQSSGERVPSKTPAYEEWSASTANL